MLKWSIELGKNTYIQILKLVHWNQRLMCGSKEKIVKNYRTWRIRKEGEEDLELQESALSHWWYKKLKCWKDQQFET